MTCPRCGAKPDKYNSSYYCTECGEYLPFDRDSGVETRVNTYAVAGFVTACVGLFANLLGVVPLISLILSVIGLRQIKETGEGGRTLAICGIIISVLGLIIIISLFALLAFYLGGLSQFTFP